jgi:hypothetical protein
MHQRRQFKMMSWHFGTAGSFAIALLTCLHSLSPFRRALKLLCYVGYRTDPPCRSYYDEFPCGFLSRIDCFNGYRYEYLT